MRVAHIIAGAAHGGAELFYERLVRAQHEAGDEVRAILRPDPARLARLSGIPVDTLPFGPPYDLLTPWRLRRLLRRFQRPDVAVAWMNRASAAMPQGDWVSAGRLGGYYPLRHYKRCDHLIGNTRGIVDWLRTQGWPASRTHYLPNFVDDFGGAIAAPDLASLPRPLLLGLGRLHTDKGFDTLIRALPALPGTLAIAGTGPEHARLAELARSNGVADRVRFLGWRTDPGALLAACDVFVCSSRVEPLGNMVLEAWSARRPVVAADADGPRELIANDGDGLLVARENPAALADAVLKALDPSRGADLAAAGRARYEAAFARPAVLAQWRDALAGLRKA